MQPMSPKTAAAVHLITAGAVGATVYKASKGQKPHMAVLVVAGVSAALSLWSAARNAQAAWMPAAPAAAS